MIDQITGTIVSYTDTALVLQTDWMHLAITVPRIVAQSIHDSITLFTHLQWNPETGPQLFGFASKNEREVFFLLISVPKIGPKIAINILSNTEIVSLIQSIALRELNLISRISGIGPKKAEQIITTLHSKAKELVHTPEFATQAPHSPLVWQQLSEALSTLGYARAEIQTTTHYLRDASVGKELLLDKLLRSALAYLSQNSSR